MIKDSKNVGHITVSIHDGRLKYFCHKLQVLW